MAMVLLILLQIFAQQNHKTKNNTASHLFISMIVTELAFAK